MSQASEDIKVVIDDLKLQPYCGPQRNPGVAALLNFFMPGLGHLYLGRFVSTFVFFVATAISDGMFWSMINYSQEQVRRNRPPEFWLLVCGFVIVATYRFFASYWATRRAILLNMQQAGIPLP